MPAPAKLLPRRCGRPACGKARLGVILCAIACAGLASCAVGPDYHPPEPLLPGNFIAGSSLKGQADHRSDRAADTAKWWRTLHDRELDSLIDRAIVASPSLEIALDRL